jgi:hypothetical protein
MYVLQKNFVSIFHRRDGCPPEEEQPQIRYCPQSTDATGLSCKAGKSIEEFCADNPSIAGCNTETAVMPGLGPTPPPPCDPNTQSCPPDQDEEDRDEESSAEEEQISRESSGDDDGGSDSGDSGDSSDSSDSSDDS